MGGSASNGKNKLYSAGNFALVVCIVGSRRTSAQTQLTRYASVRYSSCPYSPSLFRFFALHSNNEVLALANHEIRLSYSPSAVLHNN